MSRKITAVVGLSAIAIAAGGCSGDSDAEAEFSARSAGRASGSLTTTRWATGSKPSW
jgi:hypothetical protein